MTIDRGVNLPVLTYIPLRFGRYAYFVPGLLFLLGIIFLQERDGGAVGFEFTISLAWLLALSWTVFTIFVWVLLRIELVNRAL